MLRDLDTLAQVEADGGTSEATNAGYARKVLTDASGITVTYDDANDRTDVDVPDQTWTGVGAGTNWTDLGFFFDSDTTGGTDANVLPGTWHDFVVNPAGGDITATIAVFYRATAL